VGMTRKQQMILVNDPAIAYDIISDSKSFSKGHGYDAFREVTPGHLVSMDGDNATKLRSVMMKAFSKKHMDTFAHTCFTMSSSLMQEILAKESEHVEIWELLRHLTFKVIATSLFGHDVDEKIYNDFSTVMNEWHDRIMEVIPFRHILPSSLLSRQMKVKEAYESMRSYILNEMSIAKKNMESTDGSTGDFMINSIISESEKSSLTVEETFSVIFTVVSLGHENISSAMTWCLGELAHSDDVQAKVFSEFSAFETEEAMINGILQNSFPYTQTVLKEALRLHPPVPMLSRQVSPNVVEVEKYGFTSQSNIEFIVSPYTIHRTKSIWGPDADSFNPDRWTDTTFQPWHSKAYIPWGMGARSCAGMRLVQIEAQIIIGTAVTVLKRFELAGQFPEHELKVSLRPDRGMCIKVLK